MSLPAALITGASSGIGAVFAERIAAERRYKLVLTARRIERLHELASKIRSEIWPEAQIELIPVDIAETAGREELLRTVRASGTAVELLINNAGFGSYGRFLERDEAREEQMVRLNTIAPLALTHAFLPAMVASRRGAIINVCSTAAFQPIPLMATYAATKAFLLSFTLAVAEEVRGTGVELLALCPGPTESEFHIAAGLPAKIELLRSMSAEDVVEQALRGLRTRRRIVVNGLPNRLLAMLSRKLPLAWAPPLVLFLLSKRTPLGKL